MLGYLIRIFLIAFLIYLVFKFLKNLFISNQKKRSFVKGNSQKNVPPPYDPNRVEDIDYQEVKKKDENNHQDQ